MILLSLLLSTLALANNDYSTQWNGPASSDRIGDVIYPKTKLQFGVDGVAVDVDADHPLPVTGSGGGGGGTVDQGNAGAQEWLFKDTTQRGYLAAIAAAFDANLSTRSSEATLLALSAKIPAGLTVTSTRLLVDIGTPAVSISNFPATQPVSIASMPSTPVTGPLTDTQLRATPVPVSGTVVTGGLTDTQLRATAVPVSGTVTSNSGTRVLSTNNSWHNPALADSDTQLSTYENVEGYRAADITIATTKELILDVYFTNDEGVTTVSDEAYDIPADTSIHVSSHLMGKEMFLGISNFGPGAAIVTVTTYLDKEPNGFPSGVVDTSTQPGSSFSRIRTQSSQLPAALGQANMASSMGVVIANNQSAIPVTLATAPPLVASSAVIGHVIVDTAPTTAVTGPVTDAQLRASAVPVSLSTLPALAAGSAVIGHVINDASSAVIGHVIVDTAPSTAVTNTGTFATQSTLAAETTKVIGTVNQGTSPWATQDAAVGSTAATAPTKAILAGGVFNTSPATITNGQMGQTQLDATQNTLVKVNVALPAGSAVIGHVIADASSAVIGHVVVDTAPSTAVTNAGTFATQSTLAAETTKVIGTVNISAGQTVTGISDGTNTAKVEAASTAAVAADKSLVVSQNPTGGNPCQNPSATLQSITGSTSGTAAVQIIALSGTTKIYICSMNIIGVSGTTPTFSLVQGTGSNCATGQTVVQQAWTTAAGTLYPFVTPVAVGTAGAELCYLDTGTTPIQRYTISYVQQ